MNCFRSWPHWFYLLDSPRGRAMLFLTIINIVGMKLVCDMDCDILRQQKPAVTSKKENVNNNNGGSSEAMEKLTNEKTEDYVTITSPKLYEQYNYTFDKDIIETEFVTVVSLDDANTDDYLFSDSLSPSIIEEIKSIDQISKSYKPSISAKKSLAVDDKNQSSIDNLQLEKLRSIWVVYFLFFFYNSFILVSHVFCKVFTEIEKDVYETVNPFTLLYNWVLMLATIMLVEKPNQSPLQYVLVLIQTLFSTLLWSNAWQRITAEPEELEMELPWDNTSTGSLETVVLPPYDYPTLRQMMNYTATSNEPNDGTETEVDMGEVSRLRRFLERRENSGESTVEALIQDDDRRV